MRYYLRAGVNINILDEERTSPLHVACRFATSPVVEELLNSGANVDITDSVLFIHNIIGFFFYERIKDNFY